MFHVVFAMLILVKIVHENSSKCDEEKNTCNDSNNQTSCIVTVFFTRTGAAATTVSVVTVTGVGIAGVGIAGVLVAGVGVAGVATVRI